MPQTPKKTVPSKRKSSSSAKAPSSGKAGTPQRSRQSRQTPKSTHYLFDELLPQLKKAGNKTLLKKINTEADLGRVAAWLIPLLEADQRLGLMFLADTEAFCKDMGLELGPTIQKHLRENVIFFKQRDPKLYQALKEGKKVDIGISGLRFRPSPQLQKQIPTVGTKALQKAIKDKNLNLDPAVAARFFAPRPPRRNAGKRPGISVGRPGQLTQGLLTTGGWNVVIQIEESFFLDMYTLYFEAMNALYFFMLLGQAFGGTPAETVNPDPNHEMITWFFRWIRVRFTMQAPPVPIFVLDNGAPSSPNDTNTMRFDFTISGTIESGDSSTSFDTSTPFTAQISHRGIIGAREDGQPLNIAMQNYYGAAMLGETFVTLDSGPDTVKEMLIVGAVYDYFQEELPEILLLPVPHTPPFITFDQSAVFVVDEQPANRQAVTLLFGQPGGPLEVFTEMLIPANRTITLGLHRGAATQQMEQNLPDLPLVDGGTRIERLDINLRDGYIEISGDGTADTCWCYPSVDFDFTSRVTLSIDGDGNLVANVTETDVSSTFANVHAMLAVILLGPKGIVVAAIGLALFHWIAGDMIGGEVQNQLNVSQNFNEQFSREFGIGRIVATFNEVEITRNGIFIHGDMTATFD
ncbi:MAG: hypothetical protein K8L91_30305 [Anaerolineae bacterium]|nr:hypothetical protein [Anaerolineae bacterium]